MEPVVISVGYSLFYTITSLVTKLSLQSNIPGIRSRYYHDDKQIRVNSTGKAQVIRWVE